MPNEKICLAKPTGVSYDQHVQNVVEQANRYIEVHSFVCDKYERLVGKSLSKRLQIASQYHDIGKLYSKWQIACQRDFEEYQRLDVKSKFRAKNLQQLGKTGLRHELVCLKKLLHKYQLPDELLIAIAAHHRKLSQKDEDRFINSDAKDFWDRFKKLGEQFSLLKKNNDLFHKALNLNYSYSGPRYLLQLADQRASTLEFQSVTELPDFKSFYYKFPFKDSEGNESKRPVQILAEENWIKPLLLLRAPTGGGKTDAALLWAKKQINNGKADRLVICMPTRFTSNAIEISIAEQLSSTGLYHSSAWFQKHFDIAKQNKYLNDAEKQKHLFARYLEAPVTVCTIDHLLISLSQSREDHHGIFFNLAHSCVVIDEADFYDDFTQANIQILLRVLNHFKVPVLIMSATLPQSAIKNYEQAGYTNLSIVEDNSTSNEIRCEIKECVSYSAVNEISHLLEKCLEQPSIIYANTVDKALQFYKWFKEKKFNDVTLYHSRFTELDKQKKELELLKKLGKEAWNKNEAHGVAILTQIGELSINISADFMLSEIAPGDRLVQRLGRLSRFKSNYGETYLLIPQKNGELYPAPYGNLVKRKWTASKFLIRTIELFTTGNYNAAQFVKLVNKIYPEQTVFSGIAQQNANLLFEYLFNRWLILPADQSKEEDDATTFWKSRNIAPTVDVIINEMPEYFNRYEEFLQFKLLNSVGLPQYLVQKGLKNHLISKKTAQIKDDKQECFFDNVRMYSYDQGLIITKPDFEDQFL